MMLLHHLTKYYAGCYGTYTTCLKIGTHKYTLIYILYEIENLKMCTCSIHVNTWSGNGETEVRRKQERSWWEQGECIGCVRRASCILCHTECVCPSWGEWDTMSFVDVRTVYICRISICQIAVNHAWTPPPPPHTRPPLSRATPTSLVWSDPTVTWRIWVSVRACCVTMGCPIRALVC